MPKRLAWSTPTALRDRQRRMAMVTVPGRPLAGKAVKAKRR